VLEGPVGPASPHPPVAQLLRRVTTSIVRGPAMSARFGSSAAGCDSLWYRMSPGSNRFELSDRVYIGEADRLRRRFQHYRTPGARQATNLRLNSLMLELLGAASAIEVCVITSARVDVDGHDEPLDLRHNAARLLVESAALTAARMAGQAVENL
jgi:hypothetical protein